MVDAVLAGSATILDCSAMRFVRRPGREPGR